MIHEIYSMRRFILCELALLSNLQLQKKNGLKYGSGENGIYMEFAIDILEFFEDYSFSDRKKVMELFYKNALEKLSSFEYQEEVWMKNNKVNFECIEELVMIFFDDFRDLFEEIISMHEYFELTIQEAFLLKESQFKFTKYCTLFLHRNDHNDIEWKKLCSFAKEVSTSLERNKR